MIEQYLTKVFCCISATIVLCCKGIQFLSSAVPKAPSYSEAVPHNSSFTLGPKRRGNCQFLQSILVNTDVGWIFLLTELCITNYTGWITAVNLKKIVRCHAIQDDIWFEGVITSNWTVEKGSQGDQRQCMMGIHINYFISMPSPECRGNPNFFQQII